MSESSSSLDIKIYSKYYITECTDHHDICCDSTNSLLECDDDRSKYEYEYCMRKGHTPYEDQDIPIVCLFTRYHISTDECLGMTWKKSMYHPCKESYDESEYLDIESTSSSDIWLEISFDSRRIGSYNICLVWFAR